MDESIGEPDELEPENSTGYTSELDQATPTQLILGLDHEEEMRVRSKLRSKTF